tara:strand:+ start:1817 stop:2092 length:276 start_codon:yes stop_codon:yes gene_type:complete
MWSKFWDWYERHITESLGITALILYMQIPHMIWAGDAILQSGVVWGANPVLDFFLYGIDLIEILPMINIGLIIYSRVRHKNNNGSKSRTKG